MLLKKLQPLLLLPHRVTHQMEIIIIIIIIMVTMIEAMEGIEVITTGIIMTEATIRVTITIITSTTETDTATEILGAENLVNFGWTEVTAKRRTDVTMPTPADELP